MSLKGTPSLFDGPGRAALRDDVLRRLRAAAQLADREVAHMRADAALLDLIDDPEVRAAFVAVGGWYA